MAAAGGLCRVSAHGLARPWGTGSRTGPVARGRSCPDRSGRMPGRIGRSCPGPGTILPRPQGQNAHLVKTTLFKTTNYNYADKARAEKRGGRGRGPSGGEAPFPNASRRPHKNEDKRKGPCPKAGTLGKIDHKGPVKTDYLPATSLMALDSLSTATSQSTPRMISGGTMRMMLAPMAVTSRWLSMQ